MTEEKVKLFKEMLDACEKANEECEGTELRACRNAVKQVWDNAPDEIKAEYDNEWRDSITAFADDMTANCPIDSIDMFHKIQTYMTLIAYVGNGPYDHEYFLDRSFALCTDELKHNREFALNIVYCNGISLRECPEEFRRDPEFIAAAQEWGIGEI